MTWHIVSMRRPTKSDGMEEHGRAMLTLYYAPHTCALASHAALEEAGAAYELKRIDFGKNEQRQPHYLAINPKGHAPAMVTPRGILTETAQSFPEAGLAPLAIQRAIAAELG